MSDKREAIVQAALDLIEESGLGSFTQPRVARRVGLKQGHITYYFPTRDDLLVAVADEAVRQRLTALRAAVEGPDDLHGKVAALARVLTAPEQTRVLIALTQSADQNEAVRASFGALGTGIAPLGASLLRAFGAEVSESSLALLQAMSTGLSVLALARGGDFSAVAEHLLHEFLASLAPSR